MVVLHVPDVNVWPSSWTTGTPCTISIASARIQSTHAAMTYEAWLHDSAYTKSLCIRAFRYTVEIYARRRRSSSFEFLEALRMPCLQLRVGVHAGQSTSVAVSA